MATTARRSFSIRYLGALAALLTLACADQGYAACFAPPSGIVSWWSGDGTTSDLVGTNPGTLHNGAGFTSGFVGGQAFALDGVDDYVSFVNRPVSDLIHAQFTIEWWANPGASPDRPSWGFLGSGFQNAINPVVSYDSVFSVGDGGNFQSLTALPDAPASTWTHYAIVDDGTRYRVYVNGSESYNAVISVNPASAGTRTFAIGQSGFAAPFEDYFKGALDEFTIYDRGLSASEVANIVTAGSEGKCKTCGNGSLDPGELCDDGNAVSGDGCDANCTPTACGNLAISPGEQCDDGNTVSGDGCSSTCQIEPPGPYAYVGNDGYYNTTVIDTSNDTLVPNGIPSGAIGTGYAVSRDGSRIYVANLNEASVSVLNGVTNTLVTTIPLPGAPFGDALSPDGSKLYVAIFNLPGVAIINTGTNTVMATVLVPTGAWDLRVSPDGSKVYVTNGAGLTVIDAVTNAIVATITESGGAYSLAFTPDGMRAYVTSSGEDKTFVVDTATNTVIDRIVGGGGRGIAINFTGTKAYVVSGQQVKVIAIPGDTLGTPITIANTGATYGGGITFRPDGLRAYVANGQVSVIDTTTDTFIHAVGGGNQANGFFIKSPPTACGNGVLDAGEGCDDGNLTNGDGCDANCTPTGCGNGITTAGEQCDDGNTVSGDCCDATCHNEAAGAPCFDDGNACTSDQCGAGACSHVANSAACNDGIFCDGADTCSGGVCGSHAGNPCTAGAVCANTCDEANENCLTPAGTSCTSDGNVCTADACDGAGACTHADTSIVIPASGGVFTGTTTGASALDGGCGFGTIYSPEKIYRWTPTQSGYASVDTCDTNTNFNTVVYVRTGTCDGTEVACNDDGCGAASSLFFNVTAGVTYFIIVDGYYGSSGNFTLTVTPNVATPTPTATPSATPTPSASATPGPTPGCGDGTLDPGEECDDGNTLNGDCCSATCQLVHHPDCLDHFLCYKGGTTGGTPKFAPVLGVSLVDPFGPSTVEVKKPERLCAPTNKLDEDPTAPSHPDHLAGYQAKPAAKFAGATGQVIVDQFGTIKLDLKKPVDLLVPTAKSLVAPPSAPTTTLDHFQCYKAKVSPGTPKSASLGGVTVQDQFGSMTVQVKKPARLCAPVDKNGETPSAPGHPNYLLCYQVKQTSLPKFVTRSSIFVANQFGPGTLDAKKPAELCVPAFRNPTCGDGVIDPGEACDGGTCCTAGCQYDTGHPGCLYSSTGVQTNVPISSLVGWSQCYLDTYADAGGVLSTILAACNQANLLMACRVTGSSTLLVAANAARADVLFDTGTGNVPHDANGVGWYFNSSYSWGFAPSGDAINRNSCDVNASSIGGPGPDADKRLCWHTSGGGLATGWRCGANDSLNFDATFERMIFQAP